MTSEYDPLRGDPDRRSLEDLHDAQILFERASRPYLSSSISWGAWAVLLPAAALATEWAAEWRGEGGVLMLWSVTILFGGLIEWFASIRSRSGESRNLLATWAFRVQGNLSLIGALISLGLLWSGNARLLPGLWLLLLGHSFYVLGGLAFRPLRSAGFLYQLGGAIALLPWINPLLPFALASGLANAWVAWSIRRRAEGERVEGPNSAMDS